MSTTKNNQQPSHLLDHGVRRSISKVNINEIFECDDKLYAIAKANTASANCNLQYGRSIFEFIQL